MLTIQPRNHTISNQQQYIQIQPRKSYTIKATTSEALDARPQAQLYREPHVNMQTRWWPRNTTADFNSTCQFQHRNATIDQRSPLFLNLRIQVIYHTSQTNHQTKTTSIWPSEISAHRGVVTHDQAISPHRGVVTHDGRKRFWRSPNELPSMYRDLFALTLWNSWGWGNASGDASATKAQIALSPIEVFRLVTYLPMQVSFTTWVPVIEIAHALSTKCNGSMELTRNVEPDIYVFRQWRNQRRSAENAAQMRWNSLSI